MSGASTFHLIEIVFLVLLLIGVVAVIMAGTPVMLRSWQASRATLKQYQGLLHAYALCRDAVDSVIAEIEVHPHDYVTFPPSVRDQLTAAHEATASLERNE